MAVFVHTCPHCGAEKAAFRYLYETFSAKNPKTAQGWFSCPSCTLTVTVLIERPNSTPIKNYFEDIGAAQELRVVKVYPGAGAAKAPAYVPERVGELYLEALDSLKRQKWTSAASMFRKTLEVALKVLDPTVDAWKLEKRIDQLAKDGAITPAIRDWAHELRLDGNEALHGDAAADEQTATAMHALTQHTLTYLFTLPRTVELARARRNGD